jgi:hypothetical protein
MDVLTVYKKQLEEELELVGDILLRVRATK